MSGRSATRTGSWTGEGSISKYDGALAAARNAGSVKVYAAARNAAAPKPTEFV